MFLNKKNRGFSLIEILVVIAIFGIILSFGMLTDLNIFKTDTFHAEESTIVSILQKARSRAMANMFQTTHGVCYLAPNYVIFRGSTCTVTSTSELIPTNANIAAASNFSITFPVIIFNKISGNTTSVTIHITDNIKSADIVINNEGTINW